MRVPVVMPQLGLTMTEGSVSTWLKKPGEPVARGEMLFVVSTDKADMEVESLIEGELAQIVVDLGKEVPVGTVIAYIERPGVEAEIVQAPAGAAETTQMVAEAPAAAHLLSDSSRTTERGEGPSASPRARRLAKDLGVDIARVKPSGASGRIVEEDVRQFAGSTRAAASPDAYQRPGAGDPAGAVDNLAQRIIADRIEPGCLGIYWLAQAGFVFKTPSGRIVYVDPYISDVVERLAGFKRMMACPIKAEEVVADLVVTTHEHPDHLDIDALSVIARNSRTHFAGPAECFKEFERMGIPNSRRHLLEEGRELTLAGIRVTGTFADHGELAPDALGVVLDLDGIKVYHTGDTAYRPAEFQAAIDMKPDVLIPCINGKFGNLNGEEAAMLTRDAGPRLAIASHFWMFVEHNGDPGEYLSKCAELAPGVRTIVMKPGERFLFRKS
jgi:L-ascorbate 6-phosphate lactonase